MNLKPLDKADLDLVKAAKKIIQKRYDPEKHVVGAALRTSEGEIITAVHLEAFVGRIAVCAEAIALGKALSDGYQNFDRIVAIYHPNKIVPPCGMCRELLLDYCPEIEVILENGVCRLKDLLPMKYCR